MNYNIVLLIGFLYSALSCVVLIFSQNFVSATLNLEILPTVNDSSIGVKEIGKGLPDSISNIDFLDENNILALGKTSGEIYLISDEILQTNPVLKLNVSGEVERGLLGIAIEKDAFSTDSINQTIYSELGTSVYLYFTEIHDGNLTHNRLYKYDWNGSRLINPHLILNLPLPPGPHHNGGELAMGPDGFLYVTIGDYEHIGDYRHNGILQNIKNGTAPDDTGVILRINGSEGSQPIDNPFFSNNTGDPLGKYFGYGIRNSFGISFDPITGKLWESENGPESYDEINILNPGFNGGWKIVHGPISRTNSTVANLTQLHGAKYVDPVFSWKIPVGVTGIDFMKSPKLGTKYLNNLFVGDFNNGNLYQLTVNKTRTGLNFDDIPGLQDLVADNKLEQSPIVFGTGFGRITDVKTGPDGLLYVVDYGYGKIDDNPPVHRIFKLYPK